MEVLPKLPRPVLISFTRGATREGGAALVAAAAAAQQSSTTPSADQQQVIVEMLWKMFNRSDVTERTWLSAGDQDFTTMLIQLRVDVIA